MYTVGQREHTAAQTVTIATTGDKATWAPGKYAHFVRAVSMVAKVAGAAAGVVKFDKRPTAGSDVGRGDGDVAVLNVPNPMAQGKILTKSNIKVLIKPGEEVVIEVTTAVAGMTSNDFILLVEPTPETTANLTALVETA